MRASWINTSGMPFSVNFAIVSDRFTVLTTAPSASALRTSSAPGSPFTSARTADASSAHLITRRLYAALSNQLIRERPAFRNVSPHQLLRAFDRQVQRIEAHLTVVETKDHLVAHPYPQSAPILDRDNDPASLSHLGPHLVHWQPLI